MKKLALRIEQNWYKPAWYNLWLLPLWSLVALFVVIKRQFFLVKSKPSNSVPVIVVGNITVGGTGKTPLITYLVNKARELGFNPAIISRGYGGRSENYPLLLDGSTSVEECGDEPYLLYHRLQCPVVVDPNRTHAAQLAAKQKVDVIFSDDGMQHYAMARDAEILVVDGKRFFGNGWLLPIGPLREPVSRKRSVDLSLINGEDFIVTASALINAQNGQKFPLEKLQGKSLVAICGIGNPQRFEQTLMDLGAEVDLRSFADHHAFTKKDFDFIDPKQMLVMTEKDWVKCQGFAQENWWYLKVDAKLDAESIMKVEQLLQKLPIKGQNNG